MSRPNLVLIGLPGAGKTTIGRAAARALNWPFIDFDTEIEHRAHASVAEIFARHGEDQFRRFEHSLTAELAGCSGMVMSAGGGWVVNDESVALLRSTSRIIYLRVAPSTVIVRLGLAKSRRPLLDVADPLAAVTEMLARRAPRYETADLIVDTEVVERKEVIEQVRQYALSLE
ncbi:MAG: shikimate kinase [Gemmatimonadaceae bacterium]|nr:shikimate kinase [Gemmatimonadaceae bacterium]